MSDLGGSEKVLFYFLKAHHQVKVNFSTNALFLEREVFIWAIGSMTMDTARVTGVNQPPVVSLQPRELGLNHHGSPADSITCSI